MEGLVKWARLFGLGKTGIELPGEVAGLVRIGSGKNVRLERSGSWAIPITWRLGREIFW